jgi:hypothetical protein
MIFIKAIALLILMSVCACAFAQGTFPIFTTDFENDSPEWSLEKSAGISKAGAHSGNNSLKVESEASIVTKEYITEAGTMELWLRSSSPMTNYKIKVLVSPTLANDISWTQVGTIEGTNNDTEYHAKRISIDDLGKIYLRLDIETKNGSIDIDDIAINRILLSTALQKNQQAILTEVIANLRDDRSYQVQTEALKTLGKNYIEQIEVQRQFIEYANAIYSMNSITLATAERSKMANPLLYPTFKQVVSDVKRVSSPIQKIRLDSLFRPFGSVTDTSSNIITVETLMTFAEPFKSVVANTFKESSYKNAELARKDKKFAEKNGLKIYQTAENFLNEIERELIKADRLNEELLSVQMDVDSFRKDLSKHLRNYLAFSSKEKAGENYSRVMSKDSQIREDAFRDIYNNFARKADLVQTRSRSNAQLIQFMLKANNNIDELQGFKERFNLITSAMITYYDKYEKTISTDQNPFSKPDDRKAWELRAIETRHYVQQSKEAFREKYL